MSTADRIDELLVLWQEARRRGESPSARGLCASDPGLADELRARIAAFESMEAMLGMRSRGALPRAAHTVPQHLVEKLRPLGYELHELIDQGGMGVVYRATQTELRRTVALKMIAGLRASPKQLARFRAEAEAVARLHHPHIVQIYEVGEVDGHSFFSMEYVAGGTLAHRLETGPLSPANAARLTEVLARAVYHAHARGVVHRDLKPANILLGKDEGRRMKDEKEHGVSAGLDSSFILHPSSLVPKVTDFGLAKRLGTDAGHTATGEVIGTPAYMAPEQARGEAAEIGTHSDVYALGAVLYECLTGSPPFRGGSILETLRQVISDEPVPPRGVRRDVPRDLEAICLKCLEKRPSRRYASAAELADDLRRFASGEPVSARRASLPTRALKWARRRPLPAVAVLLLSVAAVGAAAAAGVQDYAERKRQETERERREARAVAVAAQAREILHRNCYECHGEQKADRKLNVLDRQLLLDANRRNVVPGDPDHSRLIQRIEDDTMPPEEKEVDLPRVTPEELAVLREWIAGGAPPFPSEDPLRPTPPVVPRSELAAEVKAIFLSHCYECHQLSRADGGIKILNHNLLVVTRKVVVPGRPDDSELYQLLVTPDGLVMPPLTHPRMTADEIDAVRRWIEAGAPPFPRTPARRRRVVRTRGRDSVKV